MADKKKPQSQNTTNPGSLSQLSSLTEAFSGSDFSTISMEEFQSDPVAAKIMTILYAQSEKERKIAEGKVSDLMAKVKYYKTMPTTSIAFAVVSIIGTIVVGLGVSLNLNWWLILSGSILVLGGDILPIILNKKGEEL